MRLSADIRVLLLPVLFLVSCGQQAKNGEITSAMEEGFVDLTFGLEKSKAGTEEYLASGLHQGARVGFGIRLPSQWKNSDFEAGGKIDSSTGKVILFRTGEESDGFLTSLGLLYGVKKPPQKMRPEQEFTAMSLGQNLSSPLKGTAKLKMFFEPKEKAAIDKGYAEFYLNLDLKNRTAEFNEKDEGYRAAVLAALSAKP